MRKKSSGTMKSTFGLTYRQGPSSRSVKCHERRFWNVRVLNGCPAYFSQKGEQNEIGDYSCRPSAGKSLQLSTIRVWLKGELGANCLLAGLNSPICQEHFGVGRHRRSRLTRCSSPPKIKVPLVLPRVSLPPRSTAGQLTLDQHIGVRIPGGQPIFMPVFGLPAPFRFVVKGSTRKSDRLDLA